MTTFGSGVDRRSGRSWLALAFIVAVYFGADAIEASIYKPFARSIGLHMITNGSLGLAPFAALTTYRLFFNVAVVIGVFGILGRRLTEFPINGPLFLRYTLIGMGIGFVVMIANIMAIVLTGNASIAFVSQPFLLAVDHGVGWFVSDFIGASEEELFGRVALLVVAERLIGWRGAIVVSRVMFSILHLGNPGASGLWLFRLCLQGMLLAYAVYRTGSVWWSAGYHTGWNWASAPLFGAAGSGYLDQGHLLHFTPTGLALITGGAVGPEGSLFAIFAVFGALALLLALTPGWATSRTVAVATSS